MQLLSLMRAAGQPRTTAWNCAILEELREAPNSQIQGRRKQLCICSQLFLSPHGHYVGIAKCLTVEMQTWAFKELVGHSFLNATEASQNS